MSPHAVNNFVSDLVLMAQAMEKLPQVQADLADTKHELNAAYDIVQDRELRILDLKTEVEALQAKLREAEVAKDQAETMFLEADDRTSRALEFIKASFGAAGSLIQALEPPREVEPTPSKPEHIGLTDSQIADGYTTKEVEKPIGGFDVPHYEVVPPVQVSEVKPIEQTVEIGPALEHEWAKASQGQWEPDPIVDHSAPTTGTALGSGCDGVDPTDEWGNIR